MEDKNKKQEVPIWYSISILIVTGVIAFAAIMGLYQTERTLGQISTYTKLTRVTLEQIKKQTVLTDDTINELIQLLKEGKISEETFKISMEALDNK